MMLILGSPHHADVCDIANISVIHATPIFGVEVCKVGESVLKSNWQGGEKKGGANKYNWPFQGPWGAFKTTDDPTWLTNITPGMHLGE
jgi:hypothetical protein